MGASGAFLACLPACLRVLACACVCVCVCVRFGYMTRNDAANEIWRREHQPGLVLLLMVVLVVLVEGQTQTP